MNAPASKTQKELVNAIREFYAGEILENCRSLITPYELDIVIPEKKIAIEFDGLYWHSDDQIDSEYHVRKTTACEKIGFQLIHIFENEWQTKKIS